MKEQAIIRSYDVTDKEAVLNLLRLNTPAYFAVEEEVGFIHYLENEIQYYYVLELNKQIVGSGGFNFSGINTVGKISWDMLHPDFQGKSLGSALLHYRIEKLKQFKDLETIIVRTSQLAYTFYQKNGFYLTEVVEDYWAKGFHLYKMEYQHMNRI